MNITECKYGVKCHRRNCWFSHPSGRIIDLKVTTDFQSTGELKLEDSRKQITCRYGSLCHRNCCKFDHSEKQSQDAQPRPITMHLHPGMPKWVGNKSARCMMAANPYWHQSSHIITAEYTIIQRTPANIIVNMNTIQHIG